MSIEEVLDIIRAFFDAITKIFEELGIFKKAEDTDETTGE